MDPEETSQGSETGEEVLPVAETNENESEGGNALNPAWSPLLEKLPTSLHSMVTPELQKWDQNFQSKVNEVHSQYAPYKDYLEQQITPEQLNYALQVAEAIEKRPVDVMKGLYEYAKANNIDFNEVATLFAGTGQEQQGQIDESEIPSEFTQHPEFKKMQETLTAVTQLLVQQQDTKTQADEDAKIQAELAGLKEEFKTKGEFDEDWVMTMAYKDAQIGKNVDSLKPYVEAFFDWKTKLLASTNRPGPKVLSSGGIAPSNQVDLAKMTDSERRAYVVQTLAGAAQQNQ